MFKSLLEAIIGTKSSRDLKKIQHLVDKINSFEPQIQKLSDEELKAKTTELKKQLEDGKTLDDILPEAFAVVREAAKRVIGLRPYDVQMLGAIILHQGKISEMRTGEGKTLVAVMATYLNALSGKGVHVVTVNDYLARRDSQWMGPIHQFLGLSVGFISHDMKNEERQFNYNKDITYVTNNELGFDYLRDNMVVHKDDRVMRPLNYCIIDEVDSILIDEARTPLIISGPSEESTDKYYVINRIIPSFKVRIITDRDEVHAKYTGEDLGSGYDAVIDEKNHTVNVTEAGIAKAEKFLGITSLYDDVEAEWAHHLTQALRAHFLYEKDVEYVIKDGEIVIVDEFTGRLMPGRRWSDGLHQAVEAKEGMRIKEENQTLATITFQNFFKLYKKIAGMTGTAMTEAGEFWEIYQLDVVEIPTNMPCKRIDYKDVVYKTEKEKFAAVIVDIEDCWKRGQPVLVGTRSIEKSEKVSHLLRAKGIPHKVLNAKYHEMEAEIIAQAGKKGGVTIATNMAGRGTDIMLGGNPSVEAEAQHIKTEGGLHVIGTERHESRRIDNQLRGRCARQGDPGSSRFYLGLDDELMRLFGSDKISYIMDKLGMPEGEAIESSLITKQIEGAQKKVEAYHFNSRKHILDYDKVMNKQRTAVYRLRNDILDAEDVTERAMEMVDEVLYENFDNWAADEKNIASWDIVNLDAFLKRAFAVEYDFNEAVKERKPREEVINEIIEIVHNNADKREGEFAERGVDFKLIKRMLMLQLLDQAWKTHLHQLDHLQNTVSLRSYAQKDPLIEYQKESFALYQTMLAKVRDQFVDYLFKIQLPPQPKPVFRTSLPPQNTLNSKYAKKAEQEIGEAKPKAGLTIGRNDMCPCGSGKKYKKCCGKNS